MFWFASDQGPLRLHLEDQEAVCFFPGEQKRQLESALGSQRNWRVAETRLKNFSGKPMAALYCRSRRQLYDFRDRLAGHRIVLQEVDIKPPDRYLMERFITGGASITAGIQEAAGFKHLVNARLTGTDYRPRLRAVSVDIETDYEASTLYSIALYARDCAKDHAQDRAQDHAEDAQCTAVRRSGEDYAQNYAQDYAQNYAEVLMIGAEADSELTTEDGSTLALRFFADEKSLLSAFLAQLEQIDPDVLLGWNVVNFDLRCLQKFADRAGVPLTLGRNRETVVWRQARDGNDRFYALLPGRVVLDGIELMRSATYQFENFSLEYVARKLLRRGKLIDDAEQRGEEITELFQSNKPALARYNLEDCRLVWDIFAQENLIGFAIERSLLTGLELDRYGGSVAALDFLYLPRLHRRRFIAPAPEQLETGNLSPGGYVMRSVPGIHDNVIVLDFKSLYPSIIRTFHVDPLALVAGLEESNPIQGYDGGCFSREQYILPQLIERLWAARDEAKAGNNAVLSQAIKIIMNSFYGVLGTRGCRFFDSRLVSSITKRGHEIIIESKKHIETQGYQVIYGDTDSVFVLLDSVDTGEVQKTGDELAANLNTWWSEKLAQEHGVESYLEIEFETHYRKFLMPTVRGSEAGSKKRYAGLIGADRVQFKGLESVRSDWSPLAREFQQVLYRKIFLEEPFEDYVKQVVADLPAGESDAQLVLRKRLRRKLNDYVKNVPPHVQAARKADTARRERNLPALYQSGGWIEYLMTVNGPEPRQYRRSAIDYDFYIDKQLAPIADAILVFKSSSMDEILNKQIGLF